MSMPELLFFRVEGEIIRLRDHIFDTDEAASWNAGIVDEALA
jgi:hypothetical protein